MYACELAKMCDEDYLANASFSEVCVDCSHPTECSKGCHRCLDQIHLSRRLGERKDYNCENLMNFYVNRYIFAYVTEMEKAYELIEAELTKLEHIHMLSIGCGPSPDLFAMVNFCEKRNLDIPIHYIGYEHNLLWEKVHGFSKEILTGHINQFTINYKDVIEEFKERNISKANVLVMQYLLSHVVYNEREKEIGTFFDDLVEHVILKMEDTSYIIINDINHYLARDKFKLLEERIKARGRSVSVKKYYFYYQGLNSFQMDGVAHQSRNLYYNIGSEFIEKYRCRTDCRSVQHIIEVKKL